MSTEFKQYQRTAISELRLITPLELNKGVIALQRKGITISEEAFKNGSPINGDMIARNPNNHQDQWLITKQYFDENFIEIKA